ncbi:L,D-transpeptidase family protein [Humidesulfovibrio idahonensis]
MLCGIFAALLCGCAAKPLPMGGEDITRPSQQLLLVVAEDWQSKAARMQRFERARPDGAWQPVGVSFPVNLGRGGLGWGRGLHGLALGSGPVKAEGDGKAPAGLFALGQGFAQDPAEVGAAKLPLLRVDDKLVCVDDGKSPAYNGFAELTPGVAPAWDSAETMRRPDGQYRLGAFVHHNTSPAVPGGGSCIFLHIWLGQGIASSGCTNMDQADMLLLLRWLDADKRPVLAQLPRKDFERFQTAWRLENAHP